VTEVAVGNSDSTMKLLAFSSLVFWVVAVICGRIYAYYPYYSY
jgi:hypothetical protein